MEKKQNVFEVEIKIEKDEFDKAMEKALDKKIKTASVDGFRKGHVPKDVYLKKFGKESLYMDTVDILLPDAYKRALDTNKYEPIIEPSVDLTSITSDGCTFKFTITTKPSVNIKKYKGLKIKQEDVKVLKEEVDAEINNMLKRYSEIKVKEDGAVDKGNIAIIDFEGFKDGKAFEGGKASNYSLEIGSGSFIPGFEDQLVGMKKGEEKEINVKFPDDYPSNDLKGQNATFKVKVNEIKEKIERTLDEDFFADLALEGVKDEASLRKNVEESLKGSKEVEAENKFVDALLEEIEKSTEVDIPEELVEHELHHMVEQFNEQLRMQGMDIKYYYEVTKTNEEKLKEQMKHEALKRIKYRFILEEIKSLENITVTDEEAEKEADTTAKSYGMKKEDFLKAIGGLESMKYEVEIKKVIEFLKENNK